MKPVTQPLGFATSSDRRRQKPWQTRLMTARAFAGRLFARTLPLLGAIPLACALVSCSRSDSTELPQEHVQSQAPHRIVALTIGAVDTLALLGTLDRVIAVEEDCFVPGTEHMAKIRNDDHSGPSKALNVESVLALRPDLVIAKEDLKPALDRRGLRVHWVPAASGLDTVIPLVEQLGGELGVPEKARAAVAAMRAKMASIEHRVAALPRVRVYYEAGKAGRTAGRGTIIDDMIRLAGGDNIAGETRLANPVLSTEAILAADPEVIVLSPWSDSPEDVAQRPGWSRIAAVRLGRIHRIPEQDRKVQSPSPTCVDGCEKMLVPWLHPSLSASDAHEGPR
jgi:iron complex transport system substrate-binding protein